MNVEFLNLWEHYFSDKRNFLYNDNKIYLNSIGNARMNRLLDKGIRAN